MGTAKAALSLCAALLLAACGFRPLYGTASVPEGAQAAFAAVQIAPIAQTNDSDRIGFILQAPARFQDRPVARERRKTLAHSLAKAHAAVTPICFV